MKLVSQLPVAINLFSIMWLTNHISGTQYNYTSDPLAKCIVVANRGDYNSLTKDIFRSIGLDF